MALLTQLLVRALVLVVVFAVALVALETSQTDDALGAGLLVFLVCVLIALVWGVVDGRRGPAGQAIVAWVLAGAALGVVTAVVIEVREPGGGTLASDLVGGVPFFAILIGVPATLGVGVGALLRRAAG